MLSTQLRASGVKVTPAAPRRSRSVVTRAAAAPEKTAEAEKPKKRRLVLVRHAEALPREKSTEMGDRERPLTARGKKQATALASAIADEHRSWAKPDVVLVSDALRTLQTLEALCLELPELAQSHTVFLPSLYDQAASAEHTTSTILAAIDRLGLTDDQRLVWVIGHNPATQEVAGSLSGETGLQLATSEAVLLKHSSARTWSELTSPAASASQASAWRLRSTLHPDGKRAKGLKPVKIGMFSTHASCEDTGVATEEASLAAAQKLSEEKAARKAEKAAARAAEAEKKEQAELLETAARAAARLAKAEKAASDQEATEAAAAAAAEAAAVAAALVAESAPKLQLPRKGKDAKLKAVAAEDKAPATPGSMSPEQLESLFALNVEPRRGNAQQRKQPRAAGKKMRVVARSAAAPTTPPPSV